MALKQKIVLEVKRSQLPKAGKGLFTKTDIKKGTRIVEYKGEIIQWKEYQKRVDECKDGYLFYINRNRCIDAYPTPQHVARYANDAAGLIRVKGLRNNSVYEIVGNKCYIVCTRNIKAGEEIFVSYTKEYWDTMRYNIKHGFEKAPGSD
jgi:SET domain-containing protein